MTPAEIAEEIRAARDDFHSLVDNATTSLGGARVLHYATQHYRHHRRQLTLTNAQRSR